MYKGHGPNDTIFEVSFQCQPTHPFAEQSCSIRATTGQISPNFQWMSRRVPEFGGISNYKRLSRSVKNYLQLKRKKPLSIYIISSYMEITLQSLIILMCFLSNNSMGRLLFLKNSYLHKGREHRNKMQALK